MDHDHLPALSALLFAAPLTVLALGGMQVAAARGSQTASVALERVASAPGRNRLVALLVMMSGVVHLGLVAGHLDEPLLTASFVVAGVGLVGLALAAVLELPRWRLLTGVLVGAILIAYLVTRVSGGEGVDGLGVATAALEFAALALVARGRTTVAGGIRS